MEDKNYTQPVDEDGNPLSNDDLADLLSTSDKVSFLFEKKQRGKVVKRATITLDVDTAGIEAKDTAQYRREIADNAVEQQRLRAEAKEIGILDEDGKDTDLDSPEKPRLVARLGELNDSFTESSARLLAKMVTSGPILGKDFSDPVVLCERDGIGPAAREALYDYFFGDSEEAEAETGNSETPNTESVCASSEPMETKEVALATS